MLTNAALALAIILALATLSRTRPAPSAKQVGEFISQAIVGLGVLFLLVILGSMAVILFAAARAIHP